MKASVALPPYPGEVHVVVVDDERRMVELVTSYLEELGFRTTGCHDGHEALVAARGPDVDAMVLDLMIPGVAGIDVCRRLRREGNDVPIVMLTARGAVAERVAGLRAGADDYLVKPFALEELVARIQAVARRRDNTEHRLAVGDVVLDPLEQRAWVADVEVTLSRREFAMLTALLENAGHVVSRQRLFDQVWDGEVDIRSNSIDVHMSRLRARLEGSATVRVTTLRGVGYRLETVDPPGRG
jgi:DNA-binding response OmpR family regulator